MVSKRLVGFALAFGLLASVICLSLMGLTEEFKFVFAAAASGLTQYLPLVGLCIFFAALLARFARPRS